MTRKPLPPFGRQFIASKGHAWVAVGDEAWDLPKRKPFPVMVMPPGEDPNCYTWPVRGLVVTVVELGSFDTERLDDLAYALMLAGARRVICAREALFRDRTLCPLRVYVQRHEERHAA